ncbi:MAG: hypothetical protein JJU33_12635 [Phycisphaerales bacterium]|nr:hypothetical protein [Phycisphaerales bacterium]
MKLPTDRVMTVFDRPSELGFERMGMVRSARPVSAAAFAACHLADAAVRSLRTAGTDAIVFDGDNDLRAWYGVDPERIEGVVHSIVERSPCVAFWVVGFPFKYMQSARIAVGDSWIDNLSPDIAVLRGPSHALCVPSTFSARLYFVPLMANCAVLGGAVMAVALGIGGLRRRWRVRRGRCGGCGYPSDPGVPRCPECGGKASSGVRPDPCALFYDPP